MNKGLLEERKYRDSVGDKKLYDILGALQFNILTSKLGLREYHTLLDIGCGPLRAGRLFISYLLPKKYYGIEPNKWMITQAIENELGLDILKTKQPSFNNNVDFDLMIFNKKYDFILAHSIFSHATKEQIKKCISQIPSILKKDGKFIFTFFKGKKNNEKEEYIYFKGVKYTINFIDKILTNNSLVWKDLNIKSPNKQIYIKAEIKK